MAGQGCSVIVTGAPAVSSQRTVSKEVVEAEIWLAFARRWAVAAVRSGAEPGAGYSNHRPCPEGPFDSAARFVAGVSML